MVEIGIVSVCGNTMCYLNYREAEVLFILSSSNQRPRHDSTRFYSYSLQYKHHVVWISTIAK